MKCDCDAAAASPPPASDELICDTSQLNRRPYNVLPIASRLYAACVVDSGTE